MGHAWKDWRRHRFVNAFCLVLGAWALWYAFVRDPHARVTVVNESGEDVFDIELDIGYGPKDKPCAVRIPRLRYGQSKTISYSCAHVDIGFSTKTQKYPNRTVWMFEDDSDYGRKLRIEVHPGGELKVKNWSSLLF